MGRHFLSLFPDALCPSIDIADMGAVDALFASEKPDFVINAAGKTGRPNVDWCEDHKLETLHANVTGPLVLAELCQKHDIYWMHLSSGCIYEGDNGGAAKFFWKFLFTNQNLERSNAQRHHWRFARRCSSAGLEITNAV